MEPTDPTQDKPAGEATSQSAMPAMEPAPEMTEAAAPEATAPTPMPAASPEPVSMAAPTATPTAAPAMSTPPTPSHEVMEFAGIGRRFVAIFLDGIVLGLVFGGLSYTMGGSGYDVNEYGEIVQTGMSIVVLQLISMVVYAAYHTYFIGSMGQTPGKRIMGIKVVTTSGEHPSYGTALMRYLVSIVSGAIFLLGYIWAFFGKEKQTWHDKAAGTFVVKA